MTYPIKVVIWDSGHWGAGGSSQPRILSELRNLELTGHLWIDEIRYVKTDSEFSQKLPHEPEQACKIREARRHKIQQSRVFRTAKVLRCAYINESIKDLHPITPDRKLLLIVVLPPGKDRTQLIWELMHLEIEASLLILPAVWRSSDELGIILETLNNTQVRPIPFVPYRFSESMRVLKEKKEAGKAIEIISAEVLSGRYPRWGRVGSRALLSEFAAPVIDCVVHAAGKPIEGSIIYKEVHGRLPCILITALHENGVLSELKILAISKFQQVNFTGTAFFAGERLIFTDAFRDTRFYSGDGDGIRSSEASRGHDAKIESRNGYHTLLSAVINKINKEVRNNEAPNNEVPNNEAPNNEAPNNEAPNNEAPNNEVPNNEAPNNEVPPTLASFQDTQEFIDKIDALLTDMQKRQILQNHFTL